MKKSGILALAGLLLVSCGQTRQVGIGASQAGIDPVGAAIEVQKIDVIFVSAWSRYQQGDRQGTVKYLNSSISALQQKGVNSRGIANLSQKVSSGKNVSENEFLQTFSNSHQQMAGQQRSLVDRFVAGRKDRSAGESMQAVAYHTERSAAWSGQPLNATQRQEISSLQIAGNALQSGSGYLVKGSGQVIKGTGWVLGKGFELVTRGGERTVGRTGSVIRGAGTGGETGSGWIESAGSGVSRFGDWILQK